MRAHRTPPVVLTSLRTSTLSASYLGGPWIRNSDVLNTYPKSQIQLPIIVRCAAILMDGLVLGMTWFKTASLMTMARRLNTKVTLATLLIRDGTIYFLLLLALNIMCAVFDTLPKGSQAQFGNGGTFVISFQDALSSIVISRFILDLREVYISKNQESNNRMSSVRFASQLSGNIGAPLGEASGSRGGDDAVENAPAPVFVSEDPLAEGLFPRSSEQSERRHRNSGDQGNTSG
ncbi:hypothetical protein NLI96_g10777 [Meripilus lineatus]|uniref:Uncharacterized protein n=1 Tax=Meripilus lineatus TaxID=2056292 RepID=A0AAD5Y9S8_9APHY|nr:hypothetical protein NLI96_g10777 [Physisporinus lineatus]